MEVGQFQDVVNHIRSFAILLHVVECVARSEIDRVWISRISQSGWMVEVIQIQVFFNRLSSSTTHRVPAHSSPPDRGWIGQ